MSGPKIHANKINGCLINENCTTSSCENKNLQDQHLKARQKQVPKPQSCISNAQVVQQSVTNRHTQLQTLATIHLPPTAAPHLPNSQLHNQQQRPSKGGIGIEPAHTIPPRYQPPPQPSIGILKHLSGGKSSYYPTSLDLSVSHINIKYPPDIPKLSSVHVPETIKAQSNSSRFIQQRPVTQNRNQLLISSSQEHDSILRVQQHQQEMLKFVRKPDQDSSIQGIMSSGIPSTTKINTEQNRHLQPLLTELRALKEANQRLLDDNQELRDLCCFLDDDRQKGRKLAREWQRFGRYTASVMRQEVSAYQTKLRQLDDKQQELITDNLELKELCLYLDEERAHIATNSICANCSTPIRTNLRDDGDGSSSSTNAEDTISALRNYERQFPDVHLSSTLNDQTLQYVRSLERRIHQLEEERISGSDNASQRTVEPIPGRPEAVIRALQVLEVREQLERDRFGNLTGTSIEHMDDGEKAIVREMCNVVWRKLESSTNEQSMEE